MKDESPLHPLTRSPAHDFGEPLPREFYARETVTVAREMVGAVLVYRTTNGLLAGRVVETEAYGPDDPASHAFRGRTMRNRAMFGPAGHAYVYRIYGVHWCLNAVTSNEGVGEAVLIRALEPLAGIDVMRQNRGIQDVRRLCRGPGSLCQALAVTGQHDALDMTDGPLYLARSPMWAGSIVSTTRVGITQAADRPWRFYMADSPYVSRR